MSTLDSRHRSIRKGVALTLALLSFSFAIFSSTYAESFTTEHSLFVWKYLMCCVGIILLGGLYFRKLRHMGFVLSTIQWFSMTGTLLTTGVGSFGLVLFPILGVASVVAYADEILYLHKVHGK